MVRAVYRQEEDSKMKSAGLKSVEVLQTVTAQAVDEPEEGDVSAVTQKMDPGIVSWRAGSQMFPLHPCPPTCVTELC